LNQLEISFGTPLRIVVASEPQVPEVVAWLTIWYEDFKLTTKGGSVMYTLAIDHLVKMQVAYVDAKGNPAAIDGAVEWESSDPALATVTVDGSDSTVCTVTPVGPAGQVQVTAYADADLGQGVKELVTTVDIGLVAGEAVAGTVTPLGEAEPIAPHASPRKK
jgi:hypothetical protein